MLADTGALEADLDTALVELKVGDVVSKVTATIIFWKLIQLKEKKAFVKSYLANDINLIKELYSTLGYNFTEVEAKIKKIDEVRRSLAGVGGRVRFPPLRCRPIRSGAGDVPVSGRVLIWASVHFIFKGSLSQELS